MARAAAAAPAGGLELKGRAIIALCLALPWATACSGSAAPEAAEVTRSAKQTPAADEPPGREDAAPAFGEDADTDRRKSASAILDAEALAELEARGLSFSERMGASDDSLADLAKQTPYGRIVEVLAADLAELDAGDPRAGVGMRFSHRLFDPAYLRSPSARFELIGALRARL